MTENGLSLGEAMALTDKNNNAFGGEGGWIWIILLFFLFGSNGFGNNNNRNCATTEDVQNQFNFSALERQNNETVAAVRQAQYDTSSTVKDVAYTNLSNIKELEASVAQLGYAQSQCCCETNRNIDSVRYDNAQNTCAITTAAAANTQKILDAIAGNRMADMQNQINQLQLQSALCGVVRYPNATTYSAGVNPLYGGSGCGCGCGTTF